MRTKLLATSISLLALSGCGTTSNLEAQHPSLTAIPHYVENSQDCGVSASAKAVSIDSTVSIYAKRRDIHGGEKGERWNAIRRYKLHAYGSLGEENSRLKSHHEETQDNSYVKGIEVQPDGSKKVLNGSVSSGVRISITNTIHDDWIAADVNALYSILNGFDDVRANGQHLMIPDMERIHTRSKAGFDRKSGYGITVTGAGEDSVAVIEQCAKGT